MKLDENLSCGVVFFCHAQPLKFVSEVLLLFKPVKWSRSPGVLSPVYYRLFDHKGLFHTAASA